jgi:hypothetical protein
MHNAHEPIFQVTFNRSRAFTPGSAVGFFHKTTTTHFANTPAFSQARLKRRIAISKGSFS